MRDLVESYIGLALLLTLFGVVGFGAILTADFHMSLREVQPVPNGDAEAGRMLVREYGCGSCHEIPGITETAADVGPPLGGIGDQSYIAGELPNTPINMINWLQFPQQIAPGTAMPDLDVTEQDAADIAAYLYTMGQ